MASLLSSQIFASGANMMLPSIKVIGFCLYSSALLVGRGYAAVQIQIRGGPPTDQAYCVEDEKQEILQSVARVLTQQAASQVFQDRAQYCSQICLPTGTPGQLCTEIEKVCNDSTSERRRGLKGVHRLAWNAPFFLFGDEGNESSSGTDDFTLDGFGSADDDVASFFSMFDNEGADDGDTSAAALAAPNSDGLSGVASKAETPSPTKAPTLSPTSTPTKNRCDFAELSQQIDLALSQLLSPACKLFLDMKFHFDCFEEPNE